MKKKKIVSLTMAALIAASALAGCSSSETNNEAASGSTDAQGGKGGDKIVINIWSKDRHDANYVQKKIDEYNQNNTDNVEVVCTLYTDNYKQAIDMAAQSGELPDILVYQGEAFNKYLTNGNWADLYPLMDDAMKEYFSSVITPGYNEFDGKLYFIPTTGSTCRLFYNKEIFERVGFVSLGSITLYPIYEMLRSLQLHKSILALVIALTGGQASNVFLVMGFTKALPKELDEAAIIDGCTIYQVYFRVILPLTKPILVVVALFSFRNAWNDYITGLVMTITAPALKTLTVAVVQLKYSVNAAAEWHIMLAGASIAIIPILIVYLFANKQFIAGLTAGAVKG